MQSGERYRDKIVLHIDYESLDNKKTEALTSVFLLRRDHRLFPVSLIACVYHHYDEFIIA